MTNINTNPFNQVFSALWELATANEEFTNLVKFGNRIRLDKDGNREPIKPQISAGDLPEVILTSENVTANIHQTSSTSSCVRRYAWLISTGDERITQYLYPVEWALFRAMSRWQERLTLLEWPHNSNWHFVKRFDFLDAREGQSIANQNRGISGWSSIWACEIEMHFRTNNLRGIE